MKPLLALSLLLLASSCINTSGTKDNTPVPIIFDTDMGPDYDDVGALTILHALADLGEADILATLTSNRYAYTAPCVSAINNYYKRPDIPVGAPLDGVDLEDGHAEKWAEALPAAFPASIPAGDLPDAVEIYRRILSAASDTSVTIVTVGFLTNLSELLRSVPDKYSSLSGYDLVEQKVKRLVSMAGHFPKGREYNVFCDSAASVKVFSEWPTPVIFSGFEIGDRILTGKRLVASDRLLSPAKLVYSIALRQDNPEGRQSWDQTAVLVAVRGVDKYFNTEEGCISVNVDGSNTWTSIPGGRHRYLTWKMPVADLASELEDLMMH
jgi:inosine-uridine nucleoside N-ribohydrolase